MVARPALHQSATGSGEISPDLDSRFDLKHWYQALKRMRRVEPIPQGGFRQMPGSRLIGRRRKTRDPLVKALETDALGPHTATATVREYSFTFNPPAALALVVVRGFASSADESSTLLVEWRDSGGAWQALAPAFLLDTETRTRVAARPPGQPVQATRIRIQIVKTGSDPETLTIGDVDAYRETDPLPEAVLRPFTFSPSEAYIFAFTPGLVDVYRNRTHVGAALTNLTASQLRRAKAPQQFDSMFVLQQNLVPERVMRRGGDHEWQRDDIPWDAIAEADLGGVYPKTTDIWEVFIRWVAGVGELYVNLIINGEETGGIQWGESEVADDLAPRLQTALLALPSMKPGVTVTGDDLTGAAAKFTVTFGGDNDGIPFNVIAQVVNTADGAGFATHIQIGKTEGEPIMSGTRGWPASGNFFQDRFVLGGYLAKPGAASASRVGEYFDHNIKAVGPDTALLVNIGTEGAERINHIVVGRHLMFFTDSAEYFVSDRVIDAEQPVNFIQTSKNGAHPNAGIYEIDDQLYYLSQDGNVLYAAEYDDVRTKYVSEPVSLLASHLVDGCRETALQRPAANSDSSRLWIGRANGRLIAAHIIRGQEVLGFCEWVTDGDVESVAVAGDNVVHLATTRIVDGVAAGCIEALEDGLWLDAAVTQTFVPPAAGPMSVPGLEAHEGAEVWAVADGFVVGPFTVAGGVITLDVPAATVTVGRWTPPRAETLPLIRVLQDGVVQLRPGRIHSVRAGIIDTDSLAIGANGRPARDVGLYRFGMPVDAPPPPVTKRVAVEGISGFSDAPTVVFTQRRPGSLHVRDWAIEAKL